MMRSTLPLLLLLAPAASADLFRLGEGREVRGSVLKETVDTYFVDVGYTILSVPKKEVLARVAEAELAIDAAGGPGAGAGAAGTTGGEKGDALFSTIRRTEQGVKENVVRTEGAVVMVTTPSGLGSGFIITEDGYVVTNDHVVQGETKITVVLFEKGKEGGIEKRKIDKVRIVATNAYLDLALLKLEGVADLPIAYLGDSAECRVGQSVYAIGNPLGLERSVSEGIVSTKNRPFEGLTYIQTTTAINPGNSGGPLFNMQGEVIGVTNMGIFMSEGLNFAIPVDAVKRFLRDRDAFAYDKDNPNTGYRYLPPPPKPGAPAKQ